ncbi:MAG TPA: hypothetical protein VNZ26_04470, partial [Vicinamibacterales bacterium]|nr:hypothetical protein [Vicinamibacterales bacterium]
DMKLSTTARYRQYFDANARPDFTPNLSLELQNKLQWTIINRMQVGPFVNYYRVTAKNATAPFVYFNYGLAVDVPLFAAFRQGRVFQ